MFQHSVDVPTADIAPWVLHMRNFTVANSPALAVGKLYFKTSEIQRYSGKNANSGQKSRKSFRSTEENDNEGGGRLLG